MPFSQSKNAPAGRRYNSRTRVAHAALLMIGIAISASASFTAASAQELARKSDSIVTQLAASPGTKIAHVIVRTSGPIGSVETAQLHRLGAAITRDLPLIGAISITVPAQQLTKLARLLFVVRISSDVTTRKTDEYAIAGSVSSTAIAGTGSFGKGVGVAVVDSGVDRSNEIPFMVGKGILGGCNFVPDATGRINPSDFSDYCGHGTHVAGIIAGSGAKATGRTIRTFIGIAPGVTIIPVRVLNAHGQGTVSQVIAGIQWVVQNRVALNVRILNLSLGHPVAESSATDPLCLAVEAAWKSGIFVVCAAGNSGRAQAEVDPALSNEGYGTAYGSIQSPGNDPYVITVGAMKNTDMVFAADGSYTYNRANDRIATYSSRGPTRLDLLMKPDIVAPGNKIIAVQADNAYLVDTAAATNQVPLSEYLTGISAGRIDTISARYFRLSGTSMAAPAAAAAAALMLGASPELTPDTLKARLMISADKWQNADGIADPLTYGAGYLNISAALSCKATVSQPALTPSLSIDPSGNVTVNLNRYIWGSGSIWGTGINDLRYIWGSGSLLDASRYLWGSSVWSDRYIWGSAGGAGVDLSSVVLKGD